MSPESTASAALVALAAAVEALAVAADPTTVAGRLPGAAAVEVVREALVVAGRLAAIAARVVPVVEADGCWASDGARSLTTWLATQGRLPHTQAADLVRLGRAFRDALPATAVAAVAGRVPVQAAHAIAAVANTPDRRTLLTAPAQECGEGFLLEFAGLPAAQFRVLTRRWAAHADPGADERGYRDATDREFLTLAQSTEGCHLTGFLTTEHGHALRAALAALTGTSPDQAGLPAGRRRAGALVTLTRLALDRDLTGATGTHRPQITAIVDYTTLHRALDHAPGNPDPGTGPAPRAERGPWTGPGPGRGRQDHTLGGTHDPTPSPAPPPGPVPVDPDRFAVAELVGTGPIPDTVLARLACDSAITRIVFGPASQILNVGRTERTYTGPKRRAIIARDRHCQYPTCDAPPALAEIHHTQHWHRDGGTSDTHTGVLLCWHHHGTVHDHGIEITHHPDGHWHFTDRHGQPLRT
ncbi:HNH endonuclease signature motif containing protein [Cellulomonas sp. ICMP 17802]|uniref:HNH endonuclease signature motif containing protein n=1 Tax=Cellulomonas sp. ICMP 17802 TaxID=3239199 RepID=UPI00351B106E